MLIVCITFDSCLWKIFSASKMATQFYVGICSREFIQGTSLPVSENVPEKSIFWWKIHQRSLVSTVP